MPPTIGSSGGREGREDRESRRRPTDRKSELVCKVKYNNGLPDIPFDPKFITYPFESTRFVQYNPTSLERTYKYELLTEHDLGVTIDLINPDTYKIDLNAYLEVEDEKLLEDEVAVATDAKRSRHHNKNVSWLRKTEYISTEYNRFTQSSEKAESKVGYNLKKMFKEEDHYKDRESQIKAIDNTFESAQTTINKHYSKPGVTAVDVLPVFPDFDMWKHPCAQVMFDSDPTPGGKPAGTAAEEMSQAMIRGMVDESGNQFVAYFLPTPETVTKRKRDVEQGQDYEIEEERYEYTLAREYNWNVKNKMSKGYEETYFFVMKPDGVYYNELETRVRLSKRRKVGATGQVLQASKSRLVVKHRELNEHEINQQDARLTMLEPQAEEEEEDEEETNVDALIDDDIANYSGNEEDKAAEEKERQKAGSGAESGDEDRRSDKGDDDRGSDRGSDRSRRSRSGSVSSRGSRSGSGSSSSGSDSDSDTEQKKKRKDEDEIFGSSGSDSD